MWENRNVNACDRTFELLGALGLGGELHQPPYCCPYNMAVHIVNRWYAL